MVLGSYLDMPPERVRFRYGFAGKPEIDGETPVRFNLSHSEGTALLAVTLGRTVGVDVERVAPERDLGGLAERFFAPREAAALRALAEDQRAAGFYACWTRKEAYLKAHGGGLSVGLDTFEVLPLTGAPVLTVAADPAEARRWSLRDLAPAPGFAGALAVEGKGWRVWCSRWG
jgi:4'-phosphopantetheinyl transferase